MPFENLNNFRKRDLVIPKGQKLVYEDCEISFVILRYVATEYTALATSPTMKQDVCMGPHIKVEMVEKR